MYTSQKVEVDTDIWDRYRDTHSLSLRNTILTAYLDIVTFNVRRMSGTVKNKADLEDIINEGVIALISCIDKYDPRRGVQFDSFASIRVRGSIIDYIRKQDWVPRNIRKKSIDAENAYIEVQSINGRPATDSEVADRLGMDLSEYNKISSEAYGFALLSYEEFLQQNMLPLKEPTSPIKTPEQNLSEEELKKSMAEAIDRLGEKERMIISLYYYENLKLKEIAAVLGLTPSRVSQIHSKALMKLQKTLGEYKTD